MRRSRRPEEAAPPVAPVPAGAGPAVAPPALDGGLQADVERGRTTAMLAGVGRLQLTVDLLERQVRRCEERIAVLEDRLAEHDAVEAPPADDTAQADAPRSESDEDTGEILVLAGDDPVDASEPVLASEPDVLPVRDASPTPLPAVSADDEAEVERGAAGSTSVLDDLPADPDA